MGLIGDTWHDAIRGKSYSGCPNLDQSGLGGKGRERETNREREIEKVWDF